MAMHLENIGLGFLDADSDEDFAVIQGILGDTAQSGDAIVGYSGNLYFHKKYGAAEIYAGAIVSSENKALELSSFYTHTSNMCVWKCRIATMDVQPPDANILERCCMITKDDGSGMTIANIVCADVLPSYLEGDEITMQVAAFPIFVQYFATEDEYAETIPKDAFGKRFFLAPGSVMPITFLNNHGAEHEERHENDDCVNICGVVKALTRGKTILGEDLESIEFLCCTIETEFGDLAIVHSFDAVDAEQRKAVKVGSIVVAYGVLQGDVAIYEYEHGAVFDEEHDLRLLRCFFEKECIERLSVVFANDAKYISDYNKNIYAGSDKIIERLNSVNDARTNKYFAHMATITASEDDLMYPVGKRYGSC
jgi:hypothetical protein